MSFNGTRLSGSRKSAVHSDAEQLDGGEWPIQTLVPVSLPASYWLTSVFCENVADWHVLFIEYIFFYLKRAFFLSPNVHEKLWKEENIALLVVVIFAVVRFGTPFLSS